MALPPTAIPFTRPMDPADIRDFVITLTQGSGDAAFLQTGEGVAAYTLALTAESALAGLLIKTDSGYSTSLTGLLIHFWLAVAAGNQSDPGFSGSGLTLGLELTVTTTNTPPRIMQRTFAVMVAQQ
jgi:DNA mismatch repair protein MutH